MINLSRSHKILYAHVHKQKFMKLKGRIDKSTVRVKDFNSPLSVIDRRNIQKSSSSIEKLHNIIKQPDLINIWGIVNNCPVHIPYMCT